MRIRHPYVIVGHPFDCRYYNDDDDDDYFDDGEVIVVMVVRYNYR